MPLFIQFFIINFRYFLIAQRWNHSVYFIFHGKLNYTFIVIFLVCYRIFRGITRASTTTCTFLFTALLRPPCLDLRLLHHLRALRSPYTFTDFNMFPQIPRSRHLANRRCVFFQSPYSFGKSRHGAPVLKIQNTALIKQRLSTPLHPVCPTLPGRFTLILFQISSLISCLCNIVISHLRYKTALSLHL